jgi:hypothetical protein
MDFSTPSADGSLGRGDERTRLLQHLSNQPFEHGRFKSNFDAPKKLERSSKNRKHVLRDAADSALGLRRRVARVTRWRLRADLNRRCH